MYDFPLVQKKNEQPDVINVTRVYMANFPDCSGRVRRLNPGKIIIYCKYIVH